VSRSDSHPALHEPSSAIHGDEDHFVPDGWDDVERGLCPCGEAVAWDEKTELWVPDRSLRVLVLTTEEVEHIRAAVDLKTFPMDTAALLAFELHLNEGD
jgi:hypothetical protein